MQLFKLEDLKLMKMNSWFLENQLLERVEFGTLLLLLLDFGLLFKFINFFYGKSKI